MTRSTLSIALLLASFMGCRETSTTRPDPAVRPSPSAAGDADASITTITTTTITTATITARGDAGAGSCYADADCVTGRSCFFKEEGCGTAGKCLVSDGPRNCIVAIPMCSCTRHVSFFGLGGCAGSGVRESWELYACACVTDADCHGGQRCVPKASMSRPDTARECRDPKP